MQSCSTLPHPYQCQRGEGPIDKLTEITLCQAQYSLDDSKDACYSAQMSANIAQINASYALYNKPNQTQAELAQHTADLKTILKKVDDQMCNELWAQENFDETCAVAGYKLGKAKSTLGATPFINEFEQVVDRICHSGSDDYVERRLAAAGAHSGDMNQIERLTDLLVEQSPVTCPQQLASVDPKIYFTAGAASGAGSALLIYVLISLLSKSTLVKNIGRASYSLAKKFGLFAASNEVAIEDDEESELVITQDPDHPEAELQEFNVQRM